MCAAIAIGGVARLHAQSPAPQIVEWERGLALRVPGAPSADMYLWVYEWNMFEAMQPGQHTHGTYKFARRIEPGGHEATVESPELHLTMRVVPDGADLILRVTNRTAQTWPELASIIPCWNPGQVLGTNPSMPVSLNGNFADPWRSRSYYVARSGLTPLDSRAMHFNVRYRPAVDRIAAAGRLAFSNKWPTSDEDAVAGLLVRESEDAAWVTGIGWEDVLSVQGHNPWNCLHAGVCIGALQPGESRTVRGKVYLFRGRKEACAERFAREFPARAP